MNENDSENNTTSPINKYKVTLESRIRDILGESIILTDDMSFSYSWEHGYEKIFIKRDPKHGSMDYSGSYHPNIICEGASICKHCGKTL